MEANSSASTSSHAPVRSSLNTTLGCRQRVCQGARHELGETWDSQQCCANVSRSRRVRANQQQTIAPGAGVGQQVRVLCDHQPHVAAARQVRHLVWWVRACITQSQRQESL